jgi:hypothetical protein
MLALGDGETRRPDRGVADVKGREVRRREISHLPFGSDEQPDPCPLWEGVCAIAAASTATGAEDHQLGFKSVNFLNSPGGGSRTHTLRIDCPLLGLLSYPGKRWDGSWEAGPSNLASRDSNPRLIHKSLWTNYKCVIPSLHSTDTVLCGVGEVAEQVVSVRNKRGDNGSQSSLGDLLRTGGSIYVGDGSTILPSAFNDPDLGKGKSIQGNASRGSCVANVRQPAASAQLRHHVRHRPPFVRVLAQNPFDTRLPAGSIIRGWRSYVRVAPPCHHAGQLVHEFGVELSEALEDHQKGISSLHFGSDPDVYLRELTEGRLKLRSNLLKVHNTEYITTSMHPRVHLLRRSLWCSNRISGASAGSGAKPWFVALHQKSLVRSVFGAREVSAPKVGAVVVGPHA